MTPDVKRPMRRIVAWLHVSNNSSWGYHAKLSCGHTRTDLSEHRLAQAARCWVCVSPEEPTFATGSSKETWLRTLQPEDAAFIRELERRSMSSWSDEELRKYNVLTGQEENNAPQDTTA